MSVAKSRIQRLEAGPGNPRVTAVLRFFHTGDPSAVPADMTDEDLREAARLVPFGARLPGLTMIKQTLGDRLAYDVVTFLRRGEQIFRRTTTVNGKPVEPTPRRTAADELLERLGIVVEIRVNRIFSDARPPNMTDDF